MEVAETFVEFGPGPALRGSAAAFAHGVEPDPET